MKRKRFLLASNPPSPGSSPGAANQPDALLRGSDKLHLDGGIATLYYAR
ncbi:MAG TPA: hypothetical protein PLO37_21320 [Candidatus Hydrogenedentes bacterium]|nr:hypothetical protein [Candidatus Hydrogenedentota bacterium]HPG69394.1 hypothetical protein [Candidatus Hydrogenedentota bacterium]